MSRRRGRDVMAPVVMLGLLAPYHPTPSARSTRQCPPSAGFKPGSLADHGSATASGSTVAIEAGDSYFEPTCETGLPTGAVELRVKNTGRLLHNISFENGGVDQDIAPGEAVMVKVIMGKEPLQFSCKYHRGGGMVGALLPPAKD